MLYCTVCPHPPGLYVVLYCIECCVVEGAPTLLHYMLFHMEESVRPTTGVGRGMDQSPRLALAWRPHACRRRPLSSRSPAALPGHPCLLALDGPRRSWAASVGGPCSCSAPTRPLACVHPMEWSRAAGLVWHDFTRLDESSWRAGTARRTKPIGGTASCYPAKGLGLTAQRFKLYFVN